MLPLLMLMMTAPPVAEAPRVQLSSLMEHRKLGSHMALLEDPSARMTLEDVLTAPAQSRFNPVHDDEPRLAHTRSAYWVRVEMDGDSSPTHWMLELSYPLHDHVDVFVLSPSGASVQRAGDAFPFALRPMKHRHFVFPINADANVRTTLYVRVQTRSAMQLAMTLWRPDAMVRADHEAQLGLGIYYGLFITMVLFNMLLFLTARDRSYAWFVLFVMCVGLLDAGVSGVAFEYLWPESPWWNKTSIPFMVMLGAASACMFSRAYLSTRIYAPTHHVALAWATGWSALGALATLVIEYRMSLALAVFTAGTAPVVSLFAGRRALAAGYEPAGYFVVSILLLLAGIGLFALRLLGFFPGNLATQYGLQLGSVAVFFLFSMGLGQRIKTAERARARAQEQALDAQRSEREKVEALNAQLENRVVERTHELAATNAELAQLNARKDELVATVSHDFRSPLTVIRQNVQTILRDLQLMDHSDLRELLQAIVRQEARLTGMCTKLLDLARLKQRGVEPRPVDVPALTRAMVDGFMSQARNAGVTLRQDIADGVKATVSGDPDRLEQVLQNLVDNALKFTPSGGHVGVVVSGQDGLVRIRITDSGCGIPTEAIPRLFDPFFQVPSTTHAGQGSGLGLAIVKAVVDAHGGRVMVASTPGAGATFTVELPVSGV